MNQTICQFSFSLSAWNIVCDKVLSKEDWLREPEDWWQHEFTDFAPKLAFLPPLKRRRLNLSARLFFETAWNLLEEDANIPVIYASLNGEVNRNFQLWHSLLTENELSPTSFSLSVHNALVGQWSEFRGVTAETEAITANGDNLEIALLEAYLLLNEGHRKVLVICGESPLEQQYNATPIERFPFNYSLALLIEQGHDYQLTLSTQPHTKTKINSSLEWVRMHYSDSHQWTTRSSNGETWKWCKK